MTLEGGEDFRWLDAAGGQKGQHVLVGGEKIILRKFAGQDPGDLFKNLRGNILFGELSGEKMDFQRLRGVCVAMPDAGDSGAFLERDAQLFLKLAAQRLFERFTGAHLAARKFPFQGRSVIAASLPDEESAILAFDDSGDNVEHGGLKW